MRLGNEMGDCGRCRLHRRTQLGVSPGQRVVQGRRHGDEPRIRVHQVPLRVEPAVGHAHDAVHAGPRLAIGNAGPALFEDALRLVEKSNANGADITAQIFPRPIGLVIGLELSGNPFMMYPSYREVAGLPLAERVAEMRKPEVRAPSMRLPPGSSRFWLRIALETSVIERL